MVNKEWPAVWIRIQHVLPKKPIKGLADPKRKRGEKIKNSEDPEAPGPVKGEHLDFHSLQQKS